MSILGPKERATYSLSSEVKNRLDERVPKSERSQYVERALERALREDAKADFFRFLEELPKSTKCTENSTDILRRMRLQWDGRPIDVLEGRKT